MRQNVLNDKRTEEYEIRMNEYEEIRNIRNNQIVLYRRKYKAYIQEVRGHRDWS